MSFKRVLWTLDEKEHDKLNEERKKEKLTWDEFLRNKTGLTENEERALAPSSA